MQVYLWIGVRVPIIDLYQELKSESSFNLYKMAF